MLVRLGFHPIRLGTRVDDQRRRLCFRAGGVLLRLLLRAHCDLLRSFPRGLKEPLNFVLGLFECVPDRGRRRAPHLELRNHAIDSLDVGVDGTAVVPAHRDWERNIEDVLRDVELEVAEALFRDLLLLVYSGRLVVGHILEYDQSRSHRGYSVTLRCRGRS